MLMETVMNEKIQAIEVAIDKLKVGLTEHTDEQQRTKLLPFVVDVETALNDLKADLSKPIGFGVVRPM
jgi:hypothetical protein